MRRLKQWLRHGFLKANGRKDGSWHMEQEWSIGIYVGKSPLDLKPPSDLRNPVLTRHEVTDVRALFVADPFMVSVNGLWYMFFELWNRDSRKGEIGLATSVDGAQWSYQRVVLAEPFHLSYP